MSFILNAIQVFFLFLAECIFDIGVKIYSLVIQIAQSDFFSQEIIRDFSGRIYVLLGIFMLFKVSFSLINYIVNPDDFTDKQKGIGKLVPNIMITLVLIVFMPRIFAEAMDLQRLVINEGVLENIIFSSNHDNELNLNSETGGEKIAVQIFNSFYYLKEVGMDSDARSITTCQNGECRYNTYTDAFDSDSSYNAYEGIWDDQAEYHQFLTLIAAVIFVLVMIQFCFDIAVRTVKLGFLQLIAPIPIISRMDPKSAKDGMFSRWLKECKNTYLALFVRLIALDFAIVLIGIIINSSELSNMDFMVKVFLILGILMFAKQLPGLIEKIFGIKLDSGFTLNPMKRLRDIPGSNIAAAGAAAVGGAALGVGSNIYAGVKAGESRRKVIGSALAGGASGLFRSGYSGLKDNKNKPFKAISTGVKGLVDARQTRNERVELGEDGISGFARRAGRKIDRFTGASTMSEDQIKKEKEFKLAQEFYKQHGEYLTDKNGKLLRDNNGNYMKAGEYELKDGSYVKRQTPDNEYKYRHFESYDKEMTDKWKQIENWKGGKYAYENSYETAKQEIQKNGSYKLKIGNETRTYTSLDKYETDMNKYVASYKKEENAFKEEMNKKEHEKFRKEYEAYTMAADAIENEINLNRLSSSNEGVQQDQQIINEPDRPNIDDHSSRFGDLSSTSGNPTFEEGNQNNHFMNQNNHFINQNQGNINQERTDLYGGGGFDDSDLE